MPIPGKDETKGEFLERCIPIVIADGTAKDGAQANAICNSIWDENKKKKESAMYVKIEEIERRCLPTSELRLDGTVEAPKITGYAAVFNTWADIGGWFKESIKKGAFAKTIKENDIRALMNHNENYVLGRNKAGTLKLQEDIKGLAVEIDPVPATWADDLMKSMRRGDVNQMSFGFQVNKSEMDFEKDERILTDVTLFDVSVVTFPVYPTTTAQVRSLFAEHRATGGISLNSAGSNLNKDIDGESKSVMDWEIFDKIIDKIKASETLTDDEIRAITAYIPNLVAPVADHATTVVEPVADHSKTDIRQGDRWMELYIRAEMQVPTIIKI